MKILSFTAGAANMFCGSCLRDNALAAELIRQGHDVVLMPLYTPTRTDEENVSQDRVFLGGISIYLQQKMSLFRHTPKLLDHLWDQPGVISLFAGRGVTVDPAQLGALTVSLLEGLDGHQRKEIENLAAWLRHEPQPDIVTLPFSLLISLARPLREATGAPVICNLQGDELFLDGLIEPWRTRALDLIRSQVDDVDGFLAVSHYQKRLMTGYLGIAPGRIQVVPLGINLDGHRFTPRQQRTPRRVGYFARVAPEKGLDLLAEAYCLLRKREGIGPCVLEAAGYMAPEHRGYLEGVERRLRDAGLGHEFRYHGEVDREGKLAFLQSIDVLSLPATYDEPKGFPVLEAMANGVPVVQPRRGAFPEMVETTGGGLLVNPDSPQALADGLSALLADHELAARLGRAGYEGVREHFTLALMAERTAAAYAAVTGASGPPTRESATAPAVASKGTG